MNSRWNLENVSDNSQLVPVLSQSGRGDELDPSHRFAPYKRVHRLLRGRYHLLLPSLLVALVAGGIYGWRKATPVYRAEGLIEVADTLPKVMYDTEDKLLGMYEEFVQSQVVLMSSRGVVTLALVDPKFKALLVDRHDMNIETFVTELLVEHPPRTQAIDVTFIDPDPNVAAQAVQSEIDAFMQISGKNGTVDQDKRMEVLKDHKAALTQQIGDIKKEIAQVQPPSVLSIAMVDDMMRSFLQDQTALEHQLDALQVAGFGESRVQVVNVRQRLAEIKAKIESYRSDVMTMQAATAASPPTDRRVAMLPAFLGFQEKIDALRTERDEADRRINALTTESGLGAERFHVLSNGETPTAPFADRRPRMAMLYGTGLAFIPLTMFCLLGLANRRFRFSEDAMEITQTAPLLGVLPELPKDDTYPDLARIAAYCVHNLRIRLQLLPGDRNHRVYMITSAAAGEGKTSLTLALGLSFAAAGRRVLLIDADQVGRGLTHRLKCEGQPGLLESVNGAGLAPVQSLMKNVFLLPAGNGSAFGSGSSLPLDELAEIVDAARTRFDLVLLDTGPVLSSLQTPIVAQVADHVIMTVSQGLKQVMCERSVQILRSVGIKVGGVVFNRARESDYRRWIGGDSYYGSSAESAWNAKNEDRPREYGPLAGSLAELAVTSTNGERK